ncbi:hypothetical protein glysoja_018465, partial [Glycine soja]
DQNIPEAQAMDEDRPETHDGRPKRRSPREHIDTVLWRTHSQISQVVRELRKTTYRVPMDVLLQQLCSINAAIYQPLYEMAQGLTSRMEQKKNKLEKRDFQHCVKELRILSFFMPFSTINL